MSLRRSSATLACLLPLAGCLPADRQPSGDATATGRDDRLWCGHGRAPLARRCTVDRVADPAGTVLIVRWPDGGFRRLLLRRSGGVEPADGAESALLKAVDAATVEARIGEDRVRLSTTLDAPAGAAR